MPFCVTLKILTDGLSDAIEKMHAVFRIEINCDELCETQETGALMSDGRILAHFKSDKKDT